MNLKLKRIAPLQAGKMLAAFYGLISLIIVPFIMVFMAVGGIAAASQHGGGAATMPMMMGMGLGFMLLLPIMYAVMGFVFGIIGAFVYNLMARWMGGFELEFEPVAPPPV